MSLDRIQELLQLMDENCLVELELQEGDFHVRLKKAGADLTMVPVSTTAPAAPTTPGTPAAAPAPAVDTSDLVPVKSPIVGTFYRSSSPDAEAFVSEGDTVNEETALCIIEAMKIMNEVKAGVSGTIEKVLVESGEPVEYGQPLFLIRP